MNYESPLKIFFDKFNTELDNGVVKACQNVGVYVSKEELIKALNYDREQYEKGYADASKDYEKLLDKTFDLLCAKIECYRCPLPQKYEKCKFGKCNFGNCKEHLREYLLGGEYE